MNVLVTAPWYGPQDRGGGVARQVQLVAEALAERGHVAVVSPNIRGRRFEKDEHNGLPLYRVYLREPPRRLSEIRRTVAFLFFFLPTLWRLRQIVRRERVAVLHLNYVASNQIYFAVLRALGGPPYVVTVRGDDAMCLHERSWSEQAAVRFVCRRAGRVVSNAKGLAESARSILGLADVGCVWNCVRFDDVPDDEAAASLVGDVPSGYVLALGGFRPQKGFDVLIRAWSRLRHRGSGRHLLLVGGEPGGEDIELIETLGCADSIHWRGLARREVILGLMRGAYCLVVPSRWEGMPNVLLEAGTMGCPVIGSTVGGIPEVICDGETGLLVPPEDDVALAAAIDCYLADPALRNRFANAHCERVRAMFSTDALADNYLEIFRDLVGRDMNSDIAPLPSSAAGAADSTKR